MVAVVTYIYIRDSHAFLASPPDKQNNGEGSASTT